MDHLTYNMLLEERLQWMRLEVSDEPLTRLAFVLVRAFLMPTWMLIPVSAVTTFVGGIALLLTFDLLLTPLSIAWMPILFILWGTSWLWFRVPILRPVLLLIGPPFALVGNAYVLLAPNPDRADKVLKLALSDQWPLTSRIL